MRRRALLLLPALAACAYGPPGGLAAVPWDAGHFMGTWFEIARLDNPDERGLEQVSIAFAPASDGTIGVLQRGLRSSTGHWIERAGQAWPLRDPGTASLALRFTGGPQQGRHVIRLAENYSIALVAGADRDALWLLARAPTLPPRTVADWLGFARAQGFDVAAMVRNPLNA